jgi:hypothetical protein
VLSNTTSDEPFINETVLALSAVIVLISVIAPEETLAALVTLLKLLLLYLTNAI